jgi:hypothetical protein
MTSTLPSREWLIAVRDHVAIRTAAMPEGSFRLDYRRLSDDETAALIEFAAPAVRDERELFHGLRRRERERLEDLLERAADRPGAFENVRRQQKEAENLAAIKKVAARFAFTRKAEERVFAEMGAHLKSGALTADSMTFLSLVVISFGLGEGLAPHARFEEGPDGMRLVLRRGFGVLAADRDSGRLSRWEAHAEHLRKNGWLTANRHGMETWIGFGPRLRRLLQEPKAK